MKVSFLLIIACLQFTSVYGLTCQVCNQAKTLEQCTTVTHCGPDQECFVDELVNSNGVFFNAGCRSIEVRSGSGHLTCYECDRVSNFEEDCNGVTTCPDDKVCGSSTHSTASGASHTFSSGCYDKRVCVPLTKKMIELRKVLEQRNQTSTGKRSEVLMCNVCCGGSYCNTGNCVKLAAKLYELAKYNNLNLDTLEYV